MMTNPRTDAVKKPMSAERGVSPAPNRNWKLHPQPSSLRKAREAVGRYIYDYGELRGKKVLDPYCGTGTLVYVASEYGADAIGSDIEDWSAYLRPLGTRCSPMFFWGVDAVDAVSVYRPDIIVTDPPNPRVLVGGRYPSAYRDTGVTGAELRRYWASRIHPKNVMGRPLAVDHLVMTLRAAAATGTKLAIVNAFDPLILGALEKVFRVDELTNTYVVVWLGDAK